MQFHLYKMSGFEECIMSLRMSHGKFYSWEKAQAIQDLVYTVTNKRGEIANENTYNHKLLALGSNSGKITGDYKNDVAEFERLLGLTMDNAMGKFDHHTLMKYIDISFFTDGLHRGAQDDLDAHAMGFNNRITRFSTRLAEIHRPKLSEWYEDKVMSFHDAHELIVAQAATSGDQNHPDEEVRENHRVFMEQVLSSDQFHPGTAMPEEIVIDSDVEGETLTFKYTPFGYVLERYADMSDKNGLKKDVIRGLITLGQEGPALWKTDLFNLRYIYFRRSKLTKANPELKAGMEQLADQIEASLPVFGPYFRKELTDSGSWEHMNRVKTVTKEEYELLMKLKAQGESVNG